MTTLLYGIIASALLSITSLLTVLFRVSPLTAPAQALPAFFFSLFLSVASIATLGLAAMWRFLPIHSWDTGKQLSVSLRQGIFIGLIVTVLLAFHIFQILTWWISLMIVVVFVLIELAMHQNN